VLNCSLRGNSSIYSFLQQVASTNYLYGGGKEIVFDFKRIESYVAKHFLSGKPYIDQDRSQFKILNYANEANVGDTRPKVASKIPQVRLPKDITDRVLKELNSAEYMQRCLRSVEIAMNFLKNTGGEGEMPLSVYASNVLQLDCTDDRTGLHIPSLQSSETDQILLEHVNSLWETLYYHLNPDPLSSLHQKFKEKIKVKEMKDVETFFEKLSPDAKAVFIDTLKQFMIDFLQDDFDEKSTIKTYLGPMLTQKDYREGLGLPDLPDQILQEFSPALANFPMIFTKHAVDLHSILTKKK